MRRTPEPRWVCVAALRGFSIVYVITVLNHRQNFANLLWCLTADDREFSKIAWKVKSDPSRWHLKVTLNFEHICTCPGTYNELSLITYANVKTEFFFQISAFFRNLSFECARKLTLPRSMILLTPVQPAPEWVDGAYLYSRRRCLVVPRGRKFWIGEEP